ncbi:Non-specific lipid-transfer protein [Melia azedarach]|uniref:Non-specific lipid-transfer protein n=2 Tax=Melia azedarach TaxID=155640 RepID=A0ACC1X037_MELAZ|nr:Non-specific lipid-transfer protein [Melia azedarach]KAJ4704262.1 Non-specific lipid-transfer protein [Melia azedarach]
MAVTLKIVCALVLCVLITAPVTHALTCGQVTSSLGPCIPFLRTGGGSPPVPCCNGVRSLNAAARTTPDRQTACRCLQTAARQISGINPNVAAGLPGACGVNIPYKISTSTDCSKVK